MKRMTGAVIALSALVAISAADIAAQDEVEARRAARGMPGVEAIMGMRERLVLTEDQIADLDAIRRESVQRRNADTAELAEIRSQFAAGQIERSEVMAFMEGRRDANQGAEERQRDRDHGAEPIVRWIEVGRRRARQEEGEYQAIDQPERGASDATHGSEIHNSDGWGWPSETPGVR